MDRPEVIEPPQKRQKTEDVSSVNAIVEVLPKTEIVEDAQAAKERGVGITELVTGNIDGFSGTLKKRYAVLSIKI
jgi:tRNA pseudouridine13 synthase